MRAEEEVKHFADDAWVVGVIVEYSVPHRLDTPAALTEGSLFQPDEFSDSFRVEAY